MKTWEVTFEVFGDASREITVSVKANTERLAIILATEKAKKESGWHSLALRNIKEKPLPA